MLTVQDVAERLSGKVSIALIYQWIEDQRLPHYRLGGGSGRRGKILVAEDDLKRFLADCKVDRHPLLD